MYEETCIVLHDFFHLGFFFVFGKICSANNLGQNLIRFNSCFHAREKC